MSQQGVFILKRANISNNEINACGSNPSEQKPQALDHSEYSISSVFSAIELNKVFTLRSLPC